jgi:uncharacterized protein
VRSLEFSFARQQFALRADRSLWWADRRTLVVADLHVGKAAVFRARGVPVPEGATDADLHRLSTAITATGAERLILLGDLFHARESIQHAAALAPLLTWREAHRSLEIILVRGNHDRSAGATPDVLRFDSIDGALIDSDIEFAHEPIANDPVIPRIAGHVHPVLRLNDFDGSGIRVPCACVDPMQMIMPAFSQFTGGATLSRMPGRSFYVVAAGRVVQA